ncbi:class I SAM-dependent methyltransferase [Devriesea agamarum]|uniref:class I SAM-dependent methyltransferase n=1 Tax=Devriesea agamarum TaxID=472569 RepID=UPI00071DB1CB|nr:class I SAM-dependent methyltransferase [Devriesea agamarum]
MEQADGSGTNSSGEDAFRRSLALVLEPEGWALLNSLPPYDPDHALSLGERLRAQGYEADLVSAVLTQSRLRAKAADKFGEFASSMLLTPDGLEQSTRLPVAVHHARRFVQAGLSSVADLGCGLGGDAMASAGLGLDVVAVDRDPVIASLARINLMHLPNARVDIGSAEDHDPASTDAVWLDPARRTERGRIFDPEACSPPLSFVVDLAHRLEVAGKGAAVGAKLGPGIAHDALPAEAETEWISWHGQVLEATVWFGILARDSVKRSALVINAQGTHLLTDRSVPATRAGTAQPDLLEVDDLGDYLFEPDGAVIRAGLIAQAASPMQARLIDPTIAYLTADQPFTSPFVTGYRVREAMPFGVKRLKSYLREHGIGRLTIKKRGTAVEPDQLRRQLRPRTFGDGEATLVLTRLRGEQSVIVCDPIAPEKASKN